MQGKAVVARFDGGRSGPTNPSLIEGNKDTGEKLIDQAKKIDPKAVEELAEEVERDKENAERFVNKN